MFEYRKSRLFSWIDFECHRSKSWTRSITEMFDFLRLLSKPAVSCYQVVVSLLLQLMIVFIISYFTDSQKVSYQFLQMSKTVNCQTVIEEFKKTRVSHLRTCNSFNFLHFWLKELLPFNNFFLWTIISCGTLYKFLWTYWFSGRPSGLMVLLKVILHIFIPLNTYLHSCWTSGFRLDFLPSRLLSVFVYFL